MASTPNKFYDPMYNFDTHFPERLSKLRLEGDFCTSGSFQKKKNRTQRSGLRYKTQPVTFDEIKEVDEEPFSSSGGEKLDAMPEQMKGHIQIFSRSMEGLLPKTALVENIQQCQYYVGPDKSGSRKFQKYRGCFSERVDQTRQLPVSSEKDSFLQKQQEFETVSETSPTSTTLSTTSSVTTCSVSATDERDVAEVEMSTISSQNQGSHRHKPTAKAKKRQKVTGFGNPS